MKIGVISSTVPLVNGGGRFIGDWLVQRLQARGHQAELVYLPFVDDPSQILAQMNAFQLVKLDDYFERVITLRPPAHVVRHPRKVVWFIHHIRVFYDQWDSPYRPVPDRAPWRALRGALIRADTKALTDAYSIFTNSRVVGDRLRQFNGIESSVLYPPIYSPEIFECGPYGESVVSICRMEHHKRQHLLIEAMQHVRTPVKLRLSGLSNNSDYLSSLHTIVTDNGISDRVHIESRWISEKEKANQLAGALAHTYVPVDEDSYGYPTLEAAHARRCTVTVDDSGGVLEFVGNGINGLVVPPEPRAIAAAFDQLYADRALAVSLGEQAHADIERLGISWDPVIDKLLA